MDHDHMINLDPQHAAALAKACGSRMEHDVSYFSLYMGEPVSIDDQWLGYLNKQYLNVFSWSLTDGSGVSQQAVHASIGLARSRNLEWIEFWGAAADIPDDLQGITISPWQDSPENREVQLDLRTLDWQGSKRQQEIRKGLRDGIQIRPYTAQKFRPEHTALVDKFLRQHSVDDIGYVLCAEKYLGCENALTIEAIDSMDRVIGLAIASCFFDETLTMLHLFHDGTPCVSTMMYNYMIQYCTAHGIETLGLGYSLNEGLLAYKKNLGASIFFPPNAGVKLMLS